MSDQILETNGVKVTLNQTPSQQIVKSNFDKTVTDSEGKVIRLKKPSPLANLDFAKAAGSDKLNVLYLAEVAHLKFVCEIDGIAVSTPSSELQLRALYQRLGEAGNEAAMKGVAEFFEQDNQSNQEAELKNF